MPYIYVSASNVLISGITKLSIYDFYEKYDNVKSIKIIPQDLKNAHKKEKLLLKSNPN